MNKNNPELYWSDVCDQEIPQLPEYDTMILEGERIKPIEWNPMAVEISLCEQRLEVLKQKERPNWLLRFVPSDLLIAIPSDGLSIGSAAVNDLVLDDPTISKFHAFLFPAENGWLLKDAGSLNGTFVNGGIISEAVKLQADDEFTLARNRRFRIERVQSDE